MSRLDSFLRRMTAQRDGLNWASERIASVPGDVLELGLGNGRTYDHLREILPDRRIWVVEREPRCHESCMPPPDTLLLGEAEAMLDLARERGVRVALVHYDLGIGREEDDRAESRALSPRIARLLVPGAVVVSAQPLSGLERIAGPDSIAPDRYLFYSG